ncbi:PREDICTED: uncharacterized protein LOC104804124 isoform X2 [Tarenaya hassleriana]|uniref:uncharacterized protein LOC104804124 isoform X2 n=1 Tax=Tarenaya hassleriana TaxID=28532 RepID=UPI00053C192B|nr:PREDICTED: uncharacterized protein LOC104804124 isoform X2 [Tarenaya hassleriana]
MGSACCVAARDKMIVPNRSEGENLQRNSVQYSPTWSFRWDNRGRVAGEETSVSWLSDGLSRNYGSDVKFGSEFVSSEGSPLDSFRAQAWQKSPQSDLSFRRTASLDVVSEQIVETNRDSIESSAPSHPSPPKFSLSLASQPSSFSTSPLSSQSNLQPASSSTPKFAHRPHLSKQVSDGQICGVKSPSRYSERRGICWSNNSRRGPSDSWSMHAFSELMSLSQRESMSYDNDSFGLRRDKIDRHGNRTSNDQQTCGACSRPLTEKSLWSSQKIITTSELSVVAVLACGHAYHAECLEHMTPEIDKFDPPCPICTLGEKKTLKLSDKALRAEMDLKARYNKRLRNRVMDSDFDRDDLVMFDHTMGGPGLKGNSPKLISSSSVKSYSPRPFLARHFSFGSRGSGKAPKDSHPGRKKGFFWTKSSKT